MPVRDTSLMALEELKSRLEPNQWKVYEIISEIGPAHDQRILEVLNQKEQATPKPRQYKRHWEINQVTGRRNELVSLQLVKCLGQYSGVWNGRKKTYCFWAVQGDYRQLAGWVRLPDKPLPELPDKCAQCPHRRQSHLAAIKQQVEGPILEKLAASAAGRTLAVYRRSRPPKRESLLLFS